ncbi:MAG: hypothetical protein EFKGCFLK_00028 [Rhodocyclaceae bacterium]|nr:MAG: right-handed parallel beta-helix repeat-containing protein [Rhodocyclaceae bacterium]MBV6406483.1 hypothetical protein [Rhodocyclaceae bacterium]CAG0928680.1 hypothetical protein RHDC3_00835 [Rhodocyclaceae bacterium]
MTNAIRIAILLSVFSVLVLAGAEALAATSYYVDAMRGSDAYSGTLAQPWRTFRHALDRLAPGDTLFVRQGNYRPEGVIPIRLLGEPGSPIRIAAFQEERPQVLSLSVRDSAWLEISGLSLEGPETLPAGWRDMPEVVIDNPSVSIDPAQKWRLGRETKVREKYRSYVHFWDWEKRGSAGLLVAASRDVVLRDNDIARHAVGIRLKDGAVRVIVEHNRIHHAYDAIDGGYGRSSVSFEECVIRNNVIRQIYREGIRLSGLARRNIVESNDIRHTGHSHIATYAAGGGNVIRGNSVRFGGYYTETMRAPGSSGISIHSAGPGTRVEGNTVAYQYDGGSRRDGNGIISDFNPDGAFIVNNVIYRVAGSGVSSVHSGNNLIAYNTIVEAGHDGQSRSNGVAIKLFARQDINNIIVGNIIYHPRLGGIHAENTSLGEQRLIDHNLFDLLPGTAFAGSGLGRKGILFDLADYRRTGHDAHAVVGDPRFVNGGTENFHLQATSPAIGAGMPAHAPARDRDGVPRHSRQPAIGAYEYRPLSGGAAGDN